MAHLDPAVHVADAACTFEAAVLITTVRACVRDSDGDKGVSIT